MKFLNADITRQPAPSTKQLNAVNSAQPSGYHFPGELLNPGPLKSITSGLEVFKDTFVERNSETK